jgi:hypothetical protein
MPTTNDQTLQKKPPNWKNGAFSVTTQPQPKPKFGQSSEDDKLKIANFADNTALVHLWLISIYLNSN